MRKPVDPDNSRDINQASKSKVMTEKSKELLKKAPVDTTKKPIAAKKLPTKSTSKVSNDIPPEAPKSYLTSKLKKWLIVAAIILVVLVAGFLVWEKLRPKGPGEEFVSGNGRIEATEVDVAAKIGGRIEDILVDEGDFVSAGQILAHMQVETLNAQRDEALAIKQQTITSVANALAQVTMRESDINVAKAVVAQRRSELEAAQLRFNRSHTLEQEGASSTQELDDDRSRTKSSNAAVVASIAQVEAAKAATKAAISQVAGAQSNVLAADAKIVRIDADIKDSALTAPRDGRVQYRIAQQGEVVASGGKVLNLVDLSDVYMTFFVPETTAGKLALGSEVHIILDAAKQYVIPANVSFVASTAQFTPKTVETASERQKLMFRVKARIDRNLLQKHLPLVKTGLPGVAWVRLNTKVEWPNELKIQVPE
jgi:HlyD family secretion protein